MTARPPGSIVSLFYDASGTDVEPGDLVVTSRTNRTYRVVAARQQDRGMHVGRWHLRAEVLDDSAAPAAVAQAERDGLAVHRLTWYPRRPARPILRRRSR